MAVGVRTLSWWDTLRLQWHVAFPAFFLGFVAPNRRFLSWFARQVPSIGYHGHYTYLATFGDVSPPC